MLHSSIHLAEAIDTDLLQEPSFLVDKTNKEVKRNNHHASNQCPPGRNERHQPCELPCGSTFILISTPHLDIMNTAQVTKTRIPVLQQPLPGKCLRPRLQATHRREKCQVASCSGSIHPIQFKQDTVAPGFAQHTMDVLGIKQSSAWKPQLASKPEEVIWPCRKLHPVHGALRFPGAGSALGTPRLPQCTSAKSQASNTASYQFSISHPTRSAR